MKKLLSIAAAGLLLLGVSFQASAIEDPDPVGSITANAYLGFAPGFGVNASADYVLINKWWKGHFTVGAYAGFYADKETKSSSAVGVTVTNKDTEAYFSLMPRATYGLNITDSFEVHAGTMAGVNFGAHKVNNSASGVGSEKSSETSAGFAFSEIVGCRYYFTDNLGVSAEIGYGSVSYMNIGVSYRF